jgi:hypothetical protein
MKFALGFIGFLIVLTLAHGGKVVWKDGKPQIEQSDKDIRGCNKQSLKDLENNATKKCSDKERR